MRKKAKSQLEKRLLLVAQQLCEMKLSAAAQKVEESIEETLTYMDYPTEHWNRIRNNTIERINREIKHQTKAIGAFPDGQSALMLVCARLRHVSASNWGTKRYLNTNHLFDLELQCKSDGQFTAS